MMPILKDFSHSSILVGLRRIPISSISASIISPGRNGWGSGWPKPPWTGKSVPQVEAQARQYIHVGYQRLVSFEDEGMKTFVEIPGEGPEAEPERIEIQTGLSDGLNIEVTAGLDEGQGVVQRPPRDIFG